MGLKPLKKRSSHIYTVIKVGILLVIVILGLLVARSSQKKRGERGSVLGRKNFSLEKEEEKITKKISKSKKKILGQTLGLSTHLVENLNPRSAKKVVSDYVYDKTLGSLIKQINRLPKWQQKKIKESVCK